MKLSKAIILLLLSNYLFGQELDGLWISSFQMNIQQVTERLDPPNGTVKLDHIEIDTFYYEAFGLIDFLKGNELVFKGLGNPENKAVYVLRNDTIVTQLDTLELKFLKEDDRLIMLDPDSSWQFNYFVFERLMPNSSKEIPIPNFDLKPYWVVQADTSSLNYGLELYLLDSGEVIISQFLDNFSRTSIGDYNTDTFRNNLFLYLLDGHLLDQKMIRLYDWNNSSFKAQSFEFGFGDEPPILTDFLIKTHELPSKKSKKSIQRNLIGSWELKNTGVPFYPELSDYDSLENEFFNFSITKTDFEIKYGADFINQHQKDFLTEKVYGTWILGPTGRFLELTYSNGQIRYLTIHELSKDTFAFNLSLKTPDSNHGYRSKTIKLKRASRH